MPEVRHIVIKVENGESPRVDAQGFNIWELSQILYYAWKATEDAVPVMDIIGVEGIVLDDGD